MKRNAFTLIEMVVALLLASIMMVGLLRVVGVVSRETMQLRKEQTDYAAVGFLADRLREDLINARGMNVNSSSVTLSGFVTGSSMLGIVRYETVSVGGTPALVRRAGNQREWMWIGFGSFQFEALEEVDRETPKPEGAGEFPPVPGRFVFGINGMDGKPLFREVMLHHAS